MVTFSVKKSRVAVTAVWIIKRNSSSRANVNEVWAHRVSHTFFLHKFNSNSEIFTRIFRMKMFTLLFYCFMFFICQLAGEVELCEWLILTSMLIRLPHSPMGTVIIMCGFVWVVWVGGYH